MSGDYLNIDGVQYASVAGSGNYGIQIVGTSSGNFQLSVNETLRNGQTRAFYYPETRSTPGSTAQLMFDLTRRPA